MNRELSPLTVAIVLGVFLLALVVVGWWATRPKNPPPPGLQPPPPEVLEMIERSKEQWEQQQRNAPR